VSPGRQARVRAAPKLRHRAKRKKRAAKSRGASTTVSEVNFNINLKDSVVVDDDIQESQKDGEKVHAGVWTELYASGIGKNPRTEALVRQSHVTSEYVKAHRTKLEASGKRGARWAGLLVTILESGEPAPELNLNGHLADCVCTECHGYRISRSWEEI
jgi:hypothetical protein